MFRFLLLLGLCSFALPAAVFSVEPKRTVFAIPYKGMGTAHFRHVEGKAWRETGPRGDGLNNFEEVDRNAEYIELYDKSRNVYVRIFATHYKWKFGKDKWDGQLDGKWVK